MNTATPEGMERQAVAMLEAMRETKLKTGGEFIDAQVLCIDENGDGHILMTPMDSDAAKARIGKMLELFFRFQRITAYFLISETWVLQIPEGASREDYLRADQSVSESEHAFDALLVSGSNADGHHVTAQCTIDESGDVPTFGDIKVLHPTDASGVLVPPLPESFEMTDVERQICQTMFVNMGNPQDETEQGAGGRVVH